MRFIILLPLDSFALSENEFKTIFSDLNTTSSGSEKKFLLTENQSIHIPLGSKHRLSNPGKLTLEMIEVQSGAYLDEDDIIRFEDKYR